jgi:hypothetical protein
MQCNIDEIVSSFVAAQDQCGWSVLSRFDSVHCEQHRVRAAPDTLSTGFKLFTYDSWFAAVDGKPAGYVDLLNGRECVTAMARFRMGSHHLGVETGRWKKIPRNQRVCACCNIDERDDELHLLRCPALNELRERFPDGFVRATPDDASVKQFMNGSLCENKYVFWRRLSRYIVDANGVRNELNNDDDQ